MPTMDTNAPGYGHDQMNDALSDTLRGERSAARLTTEDLAKASGVPLRSLNRYLLGERPITIAVLQKVAKALGVPPSSLMRQAEERIARAEAARPIPLPEEDERELRRIVEPTDPDE